MKPTYGQVIRSAGLYGFMGYCGIIAVAINEVIFEGRGTLVAATNHHIERLRGAPFLGHIAVRYKYRFYDANGLIDYEDLRAWGMVDHEDPDYSSDPDDPDDPDTVWLTDDQANDAHVVPLSAFGDDPIDTISKHTGVLESWNDLYGDEVLSCPTYKEAVRKLRRALKG